MDKAKKISYIITGFGFFGWMVINLTNYLFSYIYEVPFNFSIVKLIYIPFSIQILCLLSIRFKIFKIFSSKDKNIYLYTQLFYVLVNGIYATYVCIGQNDAYNGFSVLFTFLIGLVFLNRFLGLKGTVLSSILFFFIFYSLLYLMNINFGKDEALLCYFFGYSGIIFGFLNESTIRQMISEKRSRIFEKNYSKQLESEVALKTKRINNLVENLGQGFMVMDKEGIIQDGATEITKDFFNIDPVGKSLSEVLNLDLEKKDLLHRWLRNIWNGSFSFNDIVAFGPKFYTSQNNRYIDLKYKPIYVEGSKKEIDKVICVATDKTHEIILEKQLELDKQNAKFITTCLQNPVDFGDLMNDTYDLFEVYPVIKEMDEGELFRKFHTLKARFGQFSLKEITPFIDQVENCLSGENIDELDSNVALLKEQIDKFVQRNHLVIEAARKFMIDNGQAVLVTDFMKMIKSSKTLENLKFDLYKNYLLTDIKEKFERYKFLVEELAEKQSKIIDVDFSGDKVLVEFVHFSNLVNVCIHLFRNMVDHGIESEDERIEKQKTHRGKIDITFKNEGDYFSIHLSDDGRGIDPKRIKEKVVEKGIKKEKELEGIKNDDLIDMIFLPGVSTKEKVTDLSGRGIGMDAVREEVERLGGKITVRSKVDEGTTFKIKLPIMV